MHCIPYHITLWMDRYTQLSSCWKHAIQTEIVEEFGIHLRLLQFCAINQPGATRLENSGTFSHATSSLGNLHPKISFWIALGRFQNSAECALYATVKRQ